MNEEEIPLKIDGINENLYAGFRIRVGAGLLDLIFTLPVVFPILYINSLGKNMFYYTVIPNLAFDLLYSVYVPQKYGATFGKSVAGLTIVQRNGTSIGWREAFLRHVVIFGFALVSSAVTALVLRQADEARLADLTWLQQATYLSTLSPLLLVIGWVTNVWFYGDFIVLVTNPRKRAIHDYIANTVVVKTKYLPKIRQVMGLDATDTEHGLTSGLPGILD